MFIFEDKFLPCSNYRYRLNKFGDLLELDKGIIKSDIINSKKVVSIEWYDGLRYYEVALIIAIVKYNIQLPLEIWNEIDPIYFDKDLTNTNISNIGYRFRNGPVPVQNLPGYYYIPYYTNFAISKEGMVINLKTRNNLIFYITQPIQKKNITGGYYTCGAVQDYSKSRRVGRHRLIALAFLTYTEDPLRLVVNHKDGIPGNDFPSNLEWVTRKQNNQHAYDNNLLPNKVRPVIARNSKTGFEQSFISLAKCSQILNISEEIIRRRISINKHLRYNDGWLFKEDDGKDWPILEEKETIPFFRSEVIGRNIFTGEYIIFNSLEDASKHIDVQLESVRLNVRQESVKPINGFNFRYLKEGISWPNHSKKHLLIYKRFPKNPATGVLVTNTKGEELEFFESLNLAAEAYNCHISTIERLCKGKQKMPGKLFHKYKLTENLGPVIE